MPSLFAVQVVNALAVHGVPVRVAFTGGDPRIAQAADLYRTAEYLTHPTHWPAVLSGFDVSLHRSVRGCSAFQVAALHRSVAAGLGAETHPVNTVLRQCMRGFSYPYEDDPVRFGPYLRAVGEVLRQQAEGFDTLIRKQGKSLVHTFGPLPLAPMPQPLASALEGEDDWCPAVVMFAGIGVGQVAIMIANHLDHPLLIATGVIIILAGLLSIIPATSPLRYASRALKLPAGDPEGEVAAQMLGGGMEAFLLAAQRLLAFYEVQRWFDDAAAWRAFLVPHTDGVWFDGAAGVTAVG